MIPKSGDRFSDQIMLLPNRMIRFRNMPSTEES